MMRRTGHCERLLNSKGGEEDGDDGLAHLDGWRQCCNVLSVGSKRRCDSQWCFSHFSGFLCTMIPVENE